MAVVLPDGSVGDAGTCRSCGAVIAWVKTKNGKSAPMNLDGTSHFATCPNADAWRKRVPYGKAKEGAS